MLPPILLLTSLRVLAVEALVGLMFLRALLPAVWRQRPIRLAYGVVLALLLLAHAAWSVGLHSYPTSYWGAAMASVGVLLLGLVVASLPAAALARRVSRRLLLQGRTPPSTGVPAPRGTLTRRALVQGATALVPAAALATGINGFLGAGERIATPRIPLRFTRLPPDLEGFTILQLSDLHLGISKNMDDLEELLARFDCEERRPDLVVFTGDVADDLRQLPDALAAAWALHPKCGVFACLGNHEYLRDIKLSRPMYERSHVPLLVNEGVHVRRSRAPLWVGGIDDPISLHDDVRHRLRVNVDKALESAPADTFRLLLSHRPEGFDAAALAGVDLTLSGHTHGGQIGFNGKSAFQPLYADGYLWGSYARGPSRLYTTSGFGHWFPFRIGCPTEAPLLVLQRGSTSPLPEAESRLDARPRAGSNERRV
jgi:hypothetical protein